MRRFLGIMVLVLLVSSPASAGVFRFAFLSDGQVVNAPKDLVLQSIARSGQKAVVMAGDQNGSLASSYEDIWGAWVKAGLRFEAVAYGNHDHGRDTEAAYFHMPAPFYTRDLAENGVTVRIVVLDSNAWRKVDRQADFLEEALATATADFVFVVFHHPPVTLGGHSWWEHLRFQDAIRPVLMRHRDRITAVLVGHDHVMTVVDFGGVPIVAAGAVAYPRAGHDVDTTVGDVPAKTRWRYDVDTDAPGWARFDLDGDTRTATVHFLRARDDSEICAVTLSKAGGIRPRPGCRPVP